MSIYPCMDGNLVAPGEPNKIAEKLEWQQSFAAEYGMLTGLAT